MKKLIFVFCITILCSFCLCSAQAFADDTLEIYRLYESDFDLLLSSGCDFYSLGDVGSDKYEYDEAVNIDGAFIIADELINYVYSRLKSQKPFPIVILKLLLKSTNPLPFTPSMILALLTLFGSIPRTVFI